MADSLALIRKAKSGDDEALDALFKRYSARVLHAARLRLGPGLRGKLESQDVVQEAFVRAVKGFDRFEVRHEGAFLHWLGRLVTNVIKDRADYFGAAKRSAEHVDAADLPLASQDPTPSRRAEADEEVERLMRALDRLPEEDREVIVQRDVEELPFAEIGRLCSRTEDAARMRYVRAKARLAELLQA